MSLVGSTVGRIRILSPLGRGGMGELYVGYDETLDRRVALKSIRADRRLNARARARFLREARVLSQLDHPNICRIYDYIEQEEDDFLVLELIAGRSLEAVIREGLARDRQVRVAEQVAGALVAAHAEGVVHRDLKPSNVMLTDTGEAKVLDFGLAWTARSGPASPTPAPEERPPDTALQSPLATAGETPLFEVDRGEDEDALLTRRGVIVGTPAYMSPEQARGGCRGTWPRPRRGSRPTRTSPSAWCGSTAPDPSGDSSWRTRTATWARSSRPGATSKAR